MRMHLQAGPGAVSKQPSAARRLEGDPDEGCRRCTRRVARRPSRGRGCEGERPAHAGQQRSVHECDEPACDRGRARHVRCGQDRRLHVPGRPLLRRRGDRHRRRASGDGGATWGAPGFLPGLTFSAGAASPFERVSDASVAFDAAHSTWLISSIPLLPSLSVPTVFVSRSTDDGRTWGRRSASPRRSRTRSTSTRTGPSVTT